MQTDAAATASVQTVFSSHYIEHLAPQEVPLAPPPAFGLWALDSKPACSDQEMMALMRGHLDVGEALGFRSSA